MRILPPNTVIGRLGSSLSGPDQAISFSQLLAALGGITNVVGGPATSTIGDIATWSDTSGSTIADSGFPIASLPINVKSFGAKGDGTTDDSAAIQAAINAAATSGNRWVFFPAGTYIITSNSVLTPTTGSYTGFNFVGAGMFASVLQFGTLSSSTWFYDNGANNRLQFVSFTDLGFLGINTANFVTFASIPTNANGFKLTSGGFEQSFSFTRCLFQYLNVAFDLEGTNNDSENYFLQCKFFNIRTTVYQINNAQAVNHAFYGCDISLIYGNVFNVAAGGNINVYGGSIILVSDAGSTTYFMNVTGGAGIGIAPNLVSGARFELHGNKTLLLNVSTTVESTCTFSDCDFLEEGTAAKTAWGAVGQFGNTIFRGCNFDEQTIISGGVIQFALIGTSQSGQSGRFDFDGCRIAWNWSDRFALSSFVGSVKAINCVPFDISTSNATGAKWALDFDLHPDEPTPGLYTGWTSSNLGDNSFGDTRWRVKVAQLKVQSESWPAHSELTLQLPRNAIIKSIHLRKPPDSTGDATVCSFLVTNNNKTTTHLTSNSAAFNTAHTGDVNDYYYNVGTTTNERVLRLSTAAATTGVAQGGWVTVEYY